MTKLNKPIVLAAAMASLLGTFEAKAQFTYLDNDLLLNFRQTDGGASDLNLTVNLGSVLTFRNLTGTTSISQFTAGQLTTAFTDFNNLAFSVVATEKSNPATSPYVNNTYWATVGRAVNGVANTAPDRLGALSQGGVAGKIASIGINADSAGSDLTATATMTIDGNGTSYHSQVGSGTFAGSISYNVEQTTGAAFSGTVEADLFELIPGSGASTRLGHFELNSSGAMTYTSVTPVPEPATCALVAAGLALVAAVRRRNSSSNV